MKKKNSKNVFNSIINPGNNWKYKKNKQLMQKNKNANILDNINKITKGIQIKSNSSNTSKYKLNNKSINNNINNSPISKIKYNHLYKDDKKKVEIADNNNMNNNNSQQNDNKIINNNKTKRKN
jgi:hypothetical protein